MNTALRDAISTIIAETSPMTQSQLEDALNEISDDLNHNDRKQVLYLESVLDGIRWGVRAAKVADFGNGAMVRIILPEGGRITHEWHDRHRADAQVNAVMAALTPDITAAEKVGE